jgi:ribosomal protein S18 acetylase RimI-like enzyme
MIDGAILAHLQIEPLDRKKHDRAAFSCGEKRVENFLAYNAARQQDEGHTRVWVACLDQKPQIIGYYAINAHSVDVSTLPDIDRSKLPRFPTISAIYLSVVGVHSGYQNCGIGSYLMADAFRRSAKAAEAIGAYFIVLDALNEKAAALYRRLGFVDLAGHAPRMLIKMSQISKAVAAR